MSSRAGGVLACLLALGICMGAGAQVPAIPAGALPAAPEPTGAPTWEALEASGAVLSGVEIRPLQVFDLADPIEDSWVGRLADRIHIQTRPGVIRDALLFQPGDRVNARLIHESERALRAFRFVKEARVRPVVDAAGVHAIVEVQDAWTLKPSVSYDQVGGQRSWSWQVKEQNLFGSGKTLDIGREQRPERSTTSFLYSDPQFFGGRWTLDLGYQVLSDGWARSFQVERPFFSLQTPWAFSAKGQSSWSTFKEYDGNREVYTAPARLDEVDIKGGPGFWEGGLSAWRIQLLLTARQAAYGPLEALEPGALRAPDLRPRRFRGAGLAWNYLQDRYGDYHNLAAVRVTENYNLGWDLELDLGAYRRSLGSLVDAPFFRASVAKGWAPGPGSLWLFRIKGEGRHEPGGWQDSRTTASLTGYRQGPGLQTFAVNLALDLALRPDPEHLLYIGGTDGLRGYENHLHPGDRRWVLTAEDRILTPWVWFWGILQVGFVGFVDAGALRRLDGGGWTRTYADVGGGFRFGDLKSSLGHVVLVTLAVPLTREPGQERWQLVVGNEIRF
ncbi:MAG TPA: hypothetical protein VJ483_03640 [Holophagaceae bacterium]|nr:hypothetical protein [Holophagaceae bacterium]